MSALELTMMKRINELNEEVKLLKADIKRLSADTLKDLSLIAELQAEVERLRAGNETLQSEIKRLRASSFVTAVPSEHYERVIKAGDAIAIDYAERIEIEAGDTAKNLMRKLPVLRDWNAAKEGKPSA